MRASVAAACAVVSCACSDWCDRVVPGAAIAEPAQSTVEALPTVVDFSGVKATLTARARYSTKAWVVALDDDFDDPFAAVMTLDVALAWGPMGNPDILRDISFHLARRYVSLRWSTTMPLDQRAIMHHVANHHLIASTPEISAELERVRRGDLLELEGYLVDVTLGPHHMKTSLTRADIGNGACEVLYVEKATRRLGRSAQ